jgi:uncharacterized protein (TIGR02231 family)
MSKLFIPILLLFVSFSALQAQVVIEGKTTEVTVYRSGAMETRVASANLLTGTQEVIITNVPRTLDVNSLQVGVKGNASLLMATSRTNYLKTKEKTEQVKKWEDSLEIINNDISWIAQQRLVYQNEEAALNINGRQNTLQEGVKAEDLLKVADVMRTRGMEIKKKLFDLGKEEKKLVETRNRLQGQLSEWNSKTNIPVQEIVLQLDVKTAGQIAFRCTYRVPDASWSPVYDIRATQDNKKPVKLEYKAKVRQNSGYDWKGVLLTVSSGNPVRNQDRPILNPLFVDYSRPQMYYKGASPASMQMMERSNMAIDVMREGDKREDFDYGMDASDYGVSISDNALSVEFSIETKQDIPSDNKEHLVNLQSLELPATYTYHTVPRASNSVFLLGKLTNYGQYNLLPAAANIFYDDMFVGQTMINPATTADTLLISLGIDDKVTVKRTQLVDFTSKRIFSNNKKDTYGFEMLIRNNKNYAIDLEVLDQLPISKNKEIQVELVEGSGASYNAEYGKLLWKLKLAPNETKKLRLVYSITYPKDKEIFEFN